MPSTPIKVSGFHRRLFLVLVMVMGVLIVTGATLTHRHLARLTEQQFNSSARQMAEALAQTRQVRQAVLTGICSDLAGKPRILASLEDDALDLLYPSALNELRPIIGPTTTSGRNPVDPPVKARFYRFLDRQGHLIEPENDQAPGTLPADMRQRLVLPSLPSSPQVGYLPFASGGGMGEVFEVITVPIISNQSFQPIAALVAGFPFSLPAVSASKEAAWLGVWTENRLTMPGLPSDLLELVTESVDGLPPQAPAEIPLTLSQAGTDFRLLWQALNPDSAYPPAREILLFSMASLHHRHLDLQRRILLATAGVFLLGLLAAHLTARRFARPVEALAVASKEEHLQRLHAESALDSTSRELERAARFSADASHQLKTPVAVVRAGLEELLVDPALPAALHEEIRTLIDQTGRLTHVIEDLLLLSRLDAGRLELSLHPENLRLLIEGLVDDFSILPEPEQLDLEVQMPDSLWIKGDRIYTSLILQSLLENARKYNRPGGRIRIQVRELETAVECGIGNTGPSIPESLQPHIFERFHRGSSGERIPGYGLGLNLALELAKLHGGSLLLKESSVDWTEFCLYLQPVTPPAAEVPRVQ